MRIRIIIDTEDADDPSAINTDTPFTLNAYRDDDDGTPSRMPLEFENESVIIGGHIPDMLIALGQEWGNQCVLGPGDAPMPRDGKEWRELEAAERNPCDECDAPATGFWPALSPPVQLCDRCTHDADRSGWEPGA